MQIKLPSQDKNKFTIRSYFKNLLGKKKKRKLKKNSVFNRESYLATKISCNKYDKLSLYRRFLPPTLRAISFESITCNNILE